VRILWHAMLSHGYLSSSTIFYLLSLSFTLPYLFCLTKDSPQTRKGKGSYQHLSLYPTDDKDIWKRWSDGIKEEKIRKTKRNTKRNKKTKKTNTLCQINIFIFLRPLGLSFPVFFFCYVILLLFSSACLLYSLLLLFIPSKRNKR
jgi:stalled ribosome alternative rescue factor ArfA